MNQIPLEEGKRWLRQALQDLDDVKFTLNGDRYHLACYLAQQAAEKALKAILYAKGAEIVFGHSVAELAIKAGKYCKGLETARKRLALLDKYYIPTRYPNGLPGGIPAEAFDKDDGKKALMIATEALQLVKECMDALAAAES